MAVASQKDVSRSTWKYSRY